MLTYSSKAFDCLSHALLIVKLDAYGFHKRSLILIVNYLSNRKQRAKIKYSFSFWSEILFGGPEGFEPLLFNIFTCDMFYFMEGFEIANYADDSTPISAKLDGRTVVNELKISYSILFTWLKNNYVKENTSRSHLLLSANNKLAANIDGTVIESEGNQVLLGIIIESNLSFNKHINN